MKTTFKILHGLLIFIIYTMILPSLVYAAPIIQCDSPNVDIGSIREGEIKRIRHIFKIKNTGDEPLIINRVKPGWGCNVVDYDSIVPPGQVGKVVQLLKISKLKSGTFTKAVKVMSNAKNTDVLRLSLSGKILSVINLSSRFLHLRPDKEGKVNGSLNLSTEKKNLKIKEASFKENKGSGPSWQEQPVLFLKYAITRSDTADSDSYYTYSLKFSLAIAPPKRLSGNFTFITNHPEKENITIRGMVAPLEEKKQ